ncbi:MAG: hypothetical protein IJW43_04510 [Clostridia bacterium]|nr:hypothetical protein [Clostridia bacterium]
MGASLNLSKKKLIGLLVVIVLSLTCIIGGAITLVARNKTTNGTIYTEYGAYETVYFNVEEHSYCYVYYSGASIKELTDAYGNEKSSLGDDYGDFSVGGNTYSYMQKYYLTPGSCRVKFKATSSTIKYYIVQE